MKQRRSAIGSSPSLSDDDLDRIAHRAGVSRETVLGVLMLTAKNPSRRDELAAHEARRILSRAIASFARESESVYFLQAEGSGRIKIGTTKDPDHRIKVIRAGSPVHLRVLAVVRGGRQMEKMLHIAFAPFRCGRTEWFEPDAALLSYVRELRLRDRGADS